MSIIIENECVGPCPMGCINCGRKHVAVHHCELCGDVVYEGSDHWHEDGKNEYCDECYYEGIGFADSLTTDNMIDYGNGCTESVDINGFLASMYSKDEIETLLWNDFCAMPKEKQVECMDEWVKEDEQSWIEYFALEENAE